MAESVDGLGLGLVVGGWFLCAARSVVHLVV